MEAFEALSGVFNAAAAVDLLGTMLIEAGHDLPPVSATGLGHLLKLVERDLQASCEKLLTPN